MLQIFSTDLLNKIVYVSFCWTMLLSYSSIKMIKQLYYYLLCGVMNKIDQV